MIIPDFRCLTLLTTPPLPAPSSCIFSKSSSFISLPSRSFWLKNSFILALWAVESSVSSTASLSCLTNELKLLNFRHVISDMSDMS